MELNEFFFKRSKQAIGQIILEANNFSPNRTGFGRLCISEIIVRGLAIDQ